MTYSKSNPIKLKCQQIVFFGLLFASAVKKRAKTDRGEKKKCMVETISTQKKKKTKHWIESEMKWNEIVRSINECV